jgi:predicted ATPase
VTQSAGGLLSASAPRTKHVLKFTDRFMRKDRNGLTAYDASEGALYVLFAAVLCLARTAPRFFAIDNLDQALNPRLAARLVSRLGGWLKSSRKSRQLLFTAHNPAVLDGLDLGDDEVRLFVVERNSEGYSEVSRLNITDELRKLNEEYPLSRLWLMGHLGAVPNV